MQGSVLLLEQRTTGQQGVHYGVRLPAGSVLPTRVAEQAVEFADCSKQVSYTGLSYSAGGNYMQGPRRVGAARRQLVHGRQGG